jgi:hypothetical protein
VLQPDRLVEQQSRLRVAATPIARTRSRNTSSRAFFSAVALAGSTPDGRLDRYCTDEALARCRRWQA